MFTTILVVASNNTASNTVPSSWLVLIAVMVVAVYILHRTK